MKKIWISMSLYMICALFLEEVVCGQNTPPAAYSGATVNYVRAWDATAPGQTPASMLTGPLTDVKETTKYFDGLGRPLQTVVKQGSPLGSDLVTAHTYNSFGQEVYTYLPFASNAAQTGDLTNDGTFKADAFQQQVAFYNSQLAGQPNETNTGPGGSNWAYNQKVFEESPLNRVLSSFAPGYNFVGSQSGSVPPHNVQAELLLNTATDVVRIWNIAAAQGSIPSSSGTYGANTLHKTITIDEQGHQTIAFADSYGQTILRKVQSGTTTDNGTGSAHAGWLCTYYVYDDYGNLRFVIPPAVVQQIDGTWSITQGVADELCYRYEYDPLNRMIIKKNPGTPTGGVGEVWMVYDVRGRMVMMQDGNMRSNVSGPQWLCSLYDGLDRLVMTGTITSSNTLSQMQTAVTGQTGSNGSGTVSGAAAPTIQGNIDLTASAMTGDWQAAQSVGMDAGFSTEDGGIFIAEVVPQTVTAPVNTTVVNSNPIPSGLSLSPLTAVFYDNYNWLSTSGAALSASLDQTNTSSSTYFITSYYTSPVYAAPVVQSNQIQGQQTGRMAVAMDAGNENLYSLAIYDDRGRMIQTQNVNLTGGKDVATTQYSFSGLKLCDLMAHNKGGTNPQTHVIGTIRSYDPMGRLSFINKIVNSTVGGTAVSLPPTTIETDSYNERSMLQMKVLGASDVPSSTIETLTYDYNVRGWSLGMNRSFAKTTGAGANYFGYDLGYDNGTIYSGSTAIGSYANPTFNGNIAGMVWKSKGDNQVRKYDYGYDAPGRLTGSDFNQLDGSTFDKTAGLDFSVSGMSYDANGNLGAMNQNGWILGGSQPIDELAYSYLGGNGNSNRLQNVADNSPYNAAHPASTLGDLHYAGTKAGTAVDYGYDNNGNVTSDANRAVSSIVYNYLGLPQLITFAGGKGTIQYVYDAAGNKLRKIVTENNASVTYSGTAYPTTITTTTTYVAGCVYKSLAYVNAALAPLQYTDELQYIGQEDGRIRALYNNAATPTTPTAYALDYFIRDNVDNVRMVLTDEQWQDTYPAATVESSTIATEQTYYSITNDAAHVIPVSSLSPWWQALSGYNYPDNNTGVSNPGNPNPAATSTQVYKLNGQTGDRFGLGITLKVMAGDQVSIFGRSVWHNTGTSVSPFPITAVLSSFLGAFAGTAPVVATTHSLVTGAMLDNASATTGMLNGLLSTTPSPPQPGSEPKAAINWILFNDQFVPISMGTDLVSSTGDVIKQHSVLNVPMAANGYLYVYCSNETNIDVYFDNFQVVQTRGRILDEAHYYPAGLLMAGISDRAWNKLTNSFQYQSKEMQSQEFSDGTGLEEYDFRSRYYDPQIGRWHSQDGSTQYASPYLAMGNNWSNVTDPSGQYGWDNLVVFAVGFVVGFVEEGIADHWVHIGRAFGTGALDGVLAEGAYLGLGGGGGFGGSNLFTADAPSLVNSAAVPFSESFAATDAFTYAQNFEQISNASASQQMWLIAGYGATSAISAGFNSSGTQDKIDGFFDIAKGSAQSGALSQGIGGAFSNVGNDLLANNGHWMPSTSISAIVGFSSSYAGQLVHNGVGDLFPEGTVPNPKGGDNLYKYFSWTDIFKNVSANLASGITQQLFGNWGNIIEYQAGFQNGNPQLYDYLDLGWQRNGWGAYINGLGGFMSDMWSDAHP